MNLLDQWNLWWKETEKERPEYDLSTSANWRVASKFRNPEDKDWWYTNGYKFFNNWVEWRKKNPQMVIARMPNDEIGIELELIPTIDNIELKMYVDRVFWDKSTGEHVIVDLKTGKRTPHSSLQLAFYSYGLRKVHGIHATRGYYWMARKGELSEPLDLADMTDDKIEALVSMFDRARKDNIFIPNFDHCNMCGLSAACEWTTTREEQDE